MIEFTVSTIKVFKYPWSTEIGEYAGEGFKISSTRKKKKSAAKIDKIYHMMYHMTTVGDESIDFCLIVAE